MEDTLDPWDHSQFYNLTPPQKKKGEPESLLSKQAKKMKSVKPPSPPPVTEKKIESEPPKNKPLSMADKYSAAFMKVYLSKQEWRRKEIDRSLKSGKLSDERWDTDFVREVIQLAEAND